MTIKQARKDINRPANRNDHHKISYTAKFVAFLRLKSDIPYSEDISSMIGAEEMIMENGGKDLLVIAPLMAPMFEARYKCTNTLIKQHGAKNILELAMGAQPRGLIFTENQRNTYVGTDLPNMLEESIEVLQSIQEIHGLIRTNLMYMPVNALDYDQLQCAASIFGREPIVVCNEGLMGYLQMDEIAKLAKNIRLLLGNGGAWITPDVIYKGSTKKILDTLSPELREAMERAEASRSEKTGRDFRGNRFDDEEQAMAFFNDFGFESKAYPMCDGSFELSTLAHVPESMKDSALTMLSSRRIWVMTPRRA